MRTQLTSIACLFSLAAVVVAQNPPRQSVPLDRVIAVVNKRVVTLSDWETHAEIEALLKGQEPPSGPPGKETLDRLIDRTLIAEQMEADSFPKAPSDEVHKAAAKAREQLAPGKTNAEWKTLLFRYSLSEEEFDSAIREQIDVQHCVEVRFRPSVLITRTQIEKYYNEMLLPQMRKAGIPEDKLPDMKQVREQITNILTEQQVTEALSSWLQGLRAQSRLSIFVTETQPGPVPPSG